MFKKGSRYSLLNYKLISSTSVCCKTLEREIAAKLYEYIDSNGLFNDNQFAFRRGRTVNDQVLLMYDMVSKWYNVGYIVDVVFFDFAINSDVVSNHFLLVKLGLLGICSPFICLFDCA